MERAPATDGRWEGPRACFGTRRRRFEPLPPDADYDYTYKLHLAGGHVGGEYGDRQLAILALRPGQTLELVREPRNRHDKNAVAIYASGKQLGYVPAFKAEMTARYLDQGRTVDARVVEVTGYVPASKAEEVFQLPQPWASRRRTRRTCLVRRPRRQPLAGSLRRPHVAWLQAVGGQSDEYDN